MVHVDLTEPQRLLRDAGELSRYVTGHGIALWNARVRDISKPSIQRWNRSLGLASTAAPRDGDPDELLIVKTRLNAFGRSEARLTPTDRSRLGLPRRGREFTLGEYPVLRRRDVPVSLWRRRDLFLERWIANREGQFFRVYFAGERCVVCHCRSRAAVKRTSNAEFRANHLARRKDARRALFAAVMPELVVAVLQSAVRFADGFQLDYGALDFVCDDDDVPYIVDVNPTPWWGRDRQPGVLEHLRGGLPPDPPGRAAKSASR